MPDTAVYRLFTRLKTRIADWQRERRIAALALRAQRAVTHNGCRGYIAAWRQLCAEVMARSPEQIERMERRQGLR